MPIYGEQQNKYFDTVSKTTSIFMNGRWIVLPMRYYMDDAIQARPVMVNNEGVTQASALFRTAAAKLPIAQYGAKVEFTVKLDVNKPEKLFFDCNIAMGGQSAGTFITPLIAVLDANENEYVLGASNSAVDTVYTALYATVKQLAPQLFT